MTPEATALALSGFALLVLVHVGVQSMLLKVSVGNAWTMGPRDAPAGPGPPAARAERALRNFLETAPAFLALVLAAFVAHRDSALIGLGAWLYLAGCAAYLPGYLSGIRYLRTACWLAASVGLAIMLLGVLLG
jgi:uncharacterized MAPEG superfamily protein